MANSPPSPVQSCSPHLPLSPVEMSSPTIPSSPDSLGQSDMTLCNSSLQSGLSPNMMNSSLRIERDGASKPADVKESLFSRHGKRSQSLSPQQHFARKKPSRTSLPYPTNPAPLELRYAARVMNLKFQSEFPLEATKKFEEQLESGLSQMTTSTLYRGYKAKLATREVARQCMLLTTWEIEEAERHSIFLDGIHAENEERFKLAEWELQCFRKIFSQRGQAELGDDRNYLQAVYQDESEALRIISTQTDQVAKLLSVRVRKAFLKSPEVFPMYPITFSCLSNEEPSDSSDESCHVDDSDLDSEASCEGSEQLTT
ncbi:uncharacterized protein F5891DRAFT_1191952 [Suillus fuscotomentosus]|uniref:Uncharacterized protein n=1 Tax=Suillus fuscotomentosus TaxID=1912939 RepID=A0AAD4E0H3_9AGAM|nr:uncharacterized protein F5891DRAFT_1191952 [Suillus fuscotomentosus]KAG1897488.1 hypothetical protein F5891DRAFT_1191952 [Suillus fuscotomentosus]